MLGIAAISLWSFLLLVKTRLVIPGSFGGVSLLRYMRAFPAHPILTFYRRYGWNVVWELVPSGHLDFDRALSDRFRLW